MTPTWRTSTTPAASLEDTTVNEGRLATWSSRLWIDARYPPLFIGERKCPIPWLRRGLIAFLESEDGPTAVEYAVMLALIIVVCITAITALGNNANQTFTHVSNAVADINS